MGKNRHEIRWTTNTELMFLEGLGTYSNLPAPRLFLLRSYRASMEFRTNWGDINPAIVKTAVDQMIKEKEGGTE